MAAKIPDQLRKVAEEVNQGGERSESVRTLLSWFEAERRGYWKVHEIRKALRKVKLKTEPDFEEAWIDARQTGRFWNKRFALPEDIRLTVTLCCTRASRTSTRIADCNPVLPTSPGLGGERFFFPVQQQSFAAFSSPARTGETTRRDQTQIL